MKKILFIFVFLFSVTAFAEGETETPLYPYMNTPETVYFDDNFDDREPGAAVTGNTDEYAITSFGSTNTEQEGENIYCRTGAKWQRLRANKGIGADCDKLTIAFDAKFGVKDTYGNIYIGGEASENVMIKFVGSPGQMTVNYVDGNGSAHKLLTENAAEDGWNHIAVTIRREADGDGYAVYPEKLVLNGKVHILETAERAYSNVSWWNNMYVNIGNYNQLDVCMDNILIYSPKEYGIETFEYDYDAGKARATVTAGVSAENAEIILVDSQGEYACVCETDESKRILEINMPKELDTENKNYCIIIKAMPSVCGEKLPLYRLPVYKRLAIPIDENQLSVKNDGGSVEITAAVEPVEGKTVYLAAGVWSENKLLGFEIVPCAQPDIYTVSIEVQEAADRAQVFLIDGTESGELVSAVHNIAM